MARRITVPTRTEIAAASTSRTRSQPPAPAPGELRLLPSRFVAMREGDQEQLVDALAELLLTCLEQRPERPPVAAGLSGASALVSGFSREEEA